MRKRQITFEVVTSTPSDYVDDNFEDESQSAEEPQTTKPQIFKRRIAFAVKEEIPIDWKEKILLCLDPENRWDYGNLSKTCELFTICDCRVRKVPKEVVDSLEKESFIFLAEDGFYTRKNRQNIIRECQDE